MIKLTLFDSAGARSSDVYVSMSSIVTVQHANPSGSIITLTRGALHVREAVDQVLKTLGKWT